MSPLALFWPLLMTFASPSTIPAIYDACSFLGIAYAWNESRIVLVINLIIFLSIIAKNRFSNRGSLDEFKMFSQCCQRFFDNNYMIFGYL